MAPERPYFLDLRRITLPIGAWVSILHRMAGVTLSLGVPLLLYAFTRSLQSEADFDRLYGVCTSTWGLLLVLAMSWTGLHHLFAGLRHLGFDFGLGEGLPASRRSAWLVLLLAPVLSVLVSLVLWHA